MTEEQAAFARQVADDIEANAALYDQGMWVKGEEEHNCKTPACVAGFTAMRIVRNTWENLDGKERREALHDVWCGERPLPGYSRWDTIRDIAVTALGLAEGQATDMFVGAPFGYCLLYTSPSPRD